MRLIEDVDATGGRRILRSAYIWYRFVLLVARDTFGESPVRLLPSADPSDAPAGRERRYY